MSVEPVPSEELQRPSWLPRALAGEIEPTPGGEIGLLVAPGGFTTAARLLHEAGARFVTLLLAPEPDRSLVALFALRAHLLSVRARVPEGEASRHGSLGAWWPAARWAEQELVERHGITPLDYVPVRPLTRPDPDRIEGRVDGIDVFAIPYGPIRSGVFEAIQFPCTRF